MGFGCVRNRNKGQQDLTSGDLQALVALMKVFSAVCVPDKTKTKLHQHDLNCQSLGLLTLMDSMDVSRVGSVSQTEPNLNRGQGPCFELA